jgi:hypothetical protein
MCSLNLASQTKELNQTVLLRFRQDNQNKYLSLIKEAIFFEKLNSMFRPFTSEEIREIAMSS